MPGRARTVNEVINDAALEMGITQFAAQSVVTTADQDITQLRGLLYAVADDLMMDEPYKALFGEGFWLTDRNGLLKDRITADTDLVRIDGRLVINGLKYRFLMAKGLEYGEPLRDFTQRQNRVAAEMNGRVLDLDLDEGREL